MTNVRFYGYNVYMNDPKNISSNYCAIAQGKVSLEWYKILILAVLAGVFIALGGAVSLVAGSAYGGVAAALAKAAVFPLGLILVVLCGAELFTGNCLLFAPAAASYIKPVGMLKNLSLSYAGNFIGSLLIAVLVVYSHAYGDVTAASAVAAAAARCNTAFGYMLLRGILCNMLVCLAVWAAMSSRSAVGKIFAVYFPVFAFVACGFEHSVANMFFVPAGLMLSAEYGIAASGLGIGSGLLNGVLAPTLGNIIGGGLIALAYWAVYFRRKKASDIEPDGEKLGETKS